MSRRGDLDIKEGQVCNFCGTKDWVAVWMAHTAIFVCRDCAPTLTRWTPGMDARYAEQIWTAAKAKFWRALYCCENRQAKK